MFLSQQMRQSQKMSMKQTMTPQLIQMFRTFQQGYGQLYEEVESFVQDNPLVEFDPGEMKFMPSLSTSMDSENLDYIENYASDFESKSLTDTLFLQLEMQYLSPILNKIVSRLIDYLTPEGYLEEYSKVQTKLAKELSVSPRKISEGLKILQSFEPEGVGARSLIEALHIQLKQIDLDSDTFYHQIHQVIQYYLEDLAEKKYERISTSLGISIEDVGLIHNFIKDTLHPIPAYEYDSKSPQQVIIPSYEVKLDHQFDPPKLILTNLETTKGFKISFASKYKEMLKDPQLDNKTQEFLLKKSRDAQLFMDRIRQRQENLDRLAQLVIFRQENYFRYGNYFLEPLSQKEVSDYLDISASTVSRILSSKYIRTPHGVVSFKTLCPRNHFGKTSERLKRLLRETLSRFPNYSDRQLKDYLHELGIPISRRTITKYRLDMGVHSSYSRKDLLKSDG